MKETLLDAEATMAACGGISRSTIRRLVAEGRFPQAVVLSRNTHGFPARICWRSTEIERWIADQIAAHEAERAKGA